MNIEELVNRAIKKIESLTIEELEADCRKYGLVPVRKNLTQYKMKNNEICIDDSMYTWGAPIKNLNKNLQLLHSESANDLFYSDTPAPLAA